MSLPVLKVFATNTPTKHDSRGFLRVRVKVSRAVKEKQQESFCLPIQNTTSRAHTAASPARYALAEQFGAIKACKLIA